MTEVVSARENAGGESHSAKYRVLSLVQPDGEWEALLERLDEDGNAVWRERRIWHCPNEPRPRLEVGGIYDVYGLAGAVTTGCTHVETVALSTP